MALIGAATILVANGGANRREDRIYIGKVVFRPKAIVELGLVLNFGVKPVLHRSLTPNLIRRSV